MAKRKSLTDLVKEASSQEPEKEAPAADLSAAIQEHMQPIKSSRPPKPKRLNVDLDPDFYDAVQDKADSQGKSLSQVVRELLDLYLKV